MGTERRTGNHLEAHSVIWGERMKSWSGLNVVGVVRGGQSLDISWKLRQLDSWWIEWGHEGKRGIEENVETFGLSSCKDGAVIT